MPASSAACTHFVATSFSTCEPCVSQLPYVISEILRPLLPRYRKFMVQPYAGGPGRALRGRRDTSRYAAWRGHAAYLGLRGPDRSAAGRRHPEPGIRVEVAHEGVAAVGTALHGLGRRVRGLAREPRQEHLVLGVPGTVGEPVPVEG